MPSLSDVAIGKRPSHERATGVIDINSRITISGPDYRHLELQRSEAEKRLEF